MTISPGDVELCGKIDNCELLLYVYGDFERLDRVATEGIVLHPAGRSSETDVVRGLEAVLAHERDLLKSTHGTLFMDVKQIMADEHFGVVMGVLRASEPAIVAMPFCGLWRFDGGKLVEHWENPYSFDALQAQFSGVA